MGIMKLTNIEMENRLNSLEPLLDKEKLIGYAVARNRRKLIDALEEYSKTKDELIRKYGTEEDGRISLDVSNPNFVLFEQELLPYAMLEHEVDLMIRPVSEAVECMTGREIENTWWMFEDDLENQPETEE